MRRPTNFIGSRLNQFKTSIRQLRAPLSRDQLARVFDRLSIQASVILLHSSLSKAGYLVGGPATLIDELTVRCETLTLPTHTYCYPTSSTTAAPEFDSSSTPSRVGAISDWFWRQPGVTRSRHPSHSIAAFGSRASEFCFDHELSSTPCGAGTPYQRLIDSEAAVVLYGCTTASYTLFHTTETLLNCPYLFLENMLRLRFVNSERQIEILESWRHNMQIERRFETVGRDLEREGLLKVAPCGNSQVFYIPNCFKVHRFVAEKLTLSPRYLVAA